MTPTMCTVHTGCVFSCSLWLICPLMPLTIQSTALSLLLSSQGIHSFNRVPLRGDILSLFHLLQLGTEKHRRLEICSETDITCLRSQTPPPSGPPWHDPWRPEIIHHEEALPGGEPWKVICLPYQKNVGRCTFRAAGIHPVRTCHTKHTFPVWPGPCPRAGGVGKSALGAPKSAVLPAEPKQALALKKSHRSCFSTFNVLGAVSLGKSPSC